MKRREKHRNISLKHKWRPSVPLYSSHSYSRHWTDWQTRGTLHYSCSRSVKFNSLDTLSYARTLQYIPTTAPMRIEWDTSTRSCLHDGVEIPRWDSTPTHGTIPSSSGLRADKVVRVHVTLFSITVYSLRGRMKPSDKCQWFLQTKPQINRTNFSQQYEGISSLHFNDASFTQVWDRQDIYQWSKQKRITKQTVTGTSTAGTRAGCRVNTVWTVGRAGKWDVEALEKAWADVAATVKQDCVSPTLLAPLQRPSPNKVYPELNLPNLLKITWKPRTPEETCVL